MKATSIKLHLQPYSILNRRSTTINHAFASAIAPCTLYDGQNVSDAIKFLGQNPDDDLHCIYCGDEAHTWDHLVGLVKNKELCGYGHQLGNLVPSCRRCNSRKGGKEWEKFLDECVVDSKRRIEKTLLIKGYMARFAKPLDLGRLERVSPREWKDYAAIKGQIMKLMADADALAARIRERFARDDGAGG